MGKILKSKLENRLRDYEKIAIELCGIEGNIYNLHVEKARLEKLKQEAESKIRESLLDDGWDGKSINIDRGTHLVKARTANQEPSGWIVLTIEEYYGSEN